MKNKQFYLVEFLDAPPQAYGYAFYLSGKYDENSGQLVTAKTNINIFKNIPIPRLESKPQEQCSKHSKRLKTR
jgi:Pao retrotransposon peptidase